MSVSDVSARFHDDLRLARGGDRQALGRLLERFRIYLFAIANDEIDPSLRAKEGASDLVQETLRDAQAGFGEFRGGEELELRAWLRRILRNNLNDSARGYLGSHKRDVRREVFIDDAPRQALIDPAPTPGTRLVAAEEEIQVERALLRLPEEYRLVIDLRLRQALPFDAVGGVMNRSSDSARMLLFRAIERLQKELGVGVDDDAASRSRRIGTG